MTFVSPGIKNLREIGYIQFIDVWVKYLVHEPDAGRLEWVLLWKFDMDLPYPASKGCLSGQSRERQTCLAFIASQMGDSLSAGP
jgi:hypothetical protein